MNLPLTNKANDVIVASYELAQNSAHSVVTPLHLLSSLLDGRDGLSRKLLQKVTDVSVIEDSVRKSLQKMPKQSPPPDRMDASSALSRVIQTASKDAKAMGDSHVAVDHLLISLFKDRDITSILSKPVSTKDIEAAVQSMRSGRNVTGK